MPTKHPFTDYEPVVPPRARRVGGEAALWPESEVRSSSDETVESPSEPERVERTQQFSAAASSSLAEPATGSRVALKRGHLFSYLGLFLFTTVLYFRPYELFASLSGFTSIAFWLALLTLLIFLPSQLALEGTFTARPREVNLVLLLVVAALLSIPFAIDPVEAWDEFNAVFLKAVLMFIVLVNVVRTEKRLKGLFWLGLAISCVLSVGAINDYRLGNFVVQGERIGGLVGGMFGNPNDLALHLVTMIPLAFGLFLSTPRLLAKPLYLLCLLLMVGGVIATFSRGAFLGLAGASLVLAWKLGRRNRVLMIVLIAGFIIALLAFAPGEYTSRLGSITAVSSDASSSSRRDVLFRSIFVALRNPLFGVGMGNFHTVSIRELVSHNAYTQVGAEMGLTAMVIYIMFIVVPFRRLRLIEHETLAARRDSRIYYLAVALQASLAAYMISSFFGSVAYQFNVYYLVGYAVALRRIYEAQTGRELIPVPKLASGFSSGGRRAVGDSIDFPDRESPATMRM